jgi:hypothetical protein
MAAVTALLSQLALVLLDDHTFADLSQGQWVQVLLAAFVAGGAVYGIRNGREADHDTSTPQPRSDIAAR